MSEETMTVCQFGIIEHMCVLITDEVSTDVPVFIFTFNSCTDKFSVIA